MAGTEADFARALTSKMRAKGFFVQRIESGSTARGIPDVFAISPIGRPMWLELKRVRRAFTLPVRIPWRPGQQEWLHAVDKRGMLTRSVVAFDDCIALIPHWKVWEANVAYTADRYDTMPLLLYALSGEMSAM